MCSEAPPTPQCAHWAHLPAGWEEAARAARSRRPLHLSAPSPWGGLASPADSRLSCLSSRPRGACRAPAPSPPREMPWAWQGWLLRAYCAPGTLITKCVGAASADGQDTALPCPLSTLTPDAAPWVWDAVAPLAGG